MPTNPTRTVAAPAALAAALLLAAGCSADGGGTSMPADLPQDIPTGMENSLYSALSYAGVNGRVVGPSGKLLHATLTTANGEPAGSVHFWPSRTGSGTSVLANVTLGLTSAGAPDTWHGFHLHANDDPANGEGCVADAAKPADTHFASADGHLTARDASHGAHAGDLAPVLLGGNSQATSLFTTERFQLDDIRGKTVIVHSGPDNLANVPTGAAPDQYRPNGPEATALTNRTGNAGNRIACGVISEAPPAPGGN